MVDIDQVARQQLSDLDAVCPGMSFAKGLQLKQGEAYAIQQAVSQLRQDRGEQVIGYKVGCTSPRIQQQLGIDQPILGRLWDGSQWDDGVELPMSMFDHLAIEGELAVRLASGLSSTDGCRDIIAAAIESVFPVIELHHFVFRADRPSVEELIANNGIHAGFVAPPNPRGTLIQSSGEMVIMLGEDEVAVVPGEELRETVLSSLEWLVTSLPQHGMEMKAGDVVLCGSVAELIPVSQPGRIRVETEHWGAVTCHVAGDREYSIERDEL